MDRRTFLAGCGVAAVAASLPITAAPVTAAKPIFEEMIHQTHTVIIGTRHGNPSYTKDVSIFDTISQVLCDEAKRLGMGVEELTAIYGDVDKTFRATVEMCDEKNGWCRVEEITLRPKCLDPPAAKSLS